MAELRGKVVLVDFWTYGSVNCVNTLPHVTALYAKYRDRRRSVRANRPAPLHGY
jgi:thiol-disulfide isomerase/thioredoxin